MKSQIRLARMAFASAVLMGVQAQAVNVLDAQLDSSQKNVVLTVQYSGGCAEHTFEVQVGMCRESYPVSCDAKVIDTTREADPCEALPIKKATFSLASLGLNDPYYSGASIIFSGDHSHKSATLTLPTKNDP